MSEQTSSRRRKWDQADTSSESPAKVLKTDADADRAVDPVKVASLAAAKINALYATKKTTILPANDASKTEHSSELISGSSVSNPIPQAPSTNKLEFTKKIEINDLKNRYMLTRRPTQVEITEETGAEITTRGKYYPDANLATEKEPPLYLFISAANQESLDQAVSKINELIETATVPTPGPPLNHRHDQNNNKTDENDTQYGDRNNNNGSYSNRPPYDRPPRKFHEEDVPVDIADGPHYNLRAKIVGPQGAYVKHISSVTGCRIQLRGKGSGFYEQETGVESEEPLHIHISTPRQEMLPKAVQLAKDLIGTIKEEVEKRNQQNSYNRGYHQPPGNYHYAGYDYQGYGTEGQSTAAVPATASGNNYNYDYSQYDYYGQQQYDPSYYNQYNQYYQHQQPPVPAQTEAPQQSTNPTGSTPSRHSASPSPNSPPSNGPSSYNSVPPPSHY
ncbi:hypothetical protein BCR42DRAFT_417787 [Absidia repens]|uniref:K Homology domain-containing protein n=1 Tax=Absidia repens TaxID=90262 RepID=A0A1X2ICG8_9FUNG|nr:hypothetical protein BCR42DRAFT_417787 [Absidia repens]